MPQAQDNARFIFVVLLILWLNMGSDNGAGLLSAPSLIAGRLQRQRTAFTAMQATQWGDFEPRLQSGLQSDGRFLNLTGFRQEDGLAWDDLGTFRQRCIDWSRQAFQTTHGHSLWDAEQMMPTWQNATGTVYGPWVRRACSVSRDATSYNTTMLTGPAGWESPGGSGGSSGSSGSGVTGSSDVGVYEPTAVLGGYGSRATDDNSENDSGSGSKHVVPWGRNITGKTGRMVVRVSDDEGEEQYEYDGVARSGTPSSGGLVRAVTATVSIEDEVGTGSSHDMRLHGVHWPHKGSLLLATTSEKFAGVFGLPHLAPGEDFFQSSQRLLNRTLDAVLRQREEVRVFSAADPSYASPLWTSSVDGTPEGPYPAPRCEYVMYMQLHPVEASRVLAGPDGSGRLEDQSAEKRERRMSAAISDIEHELRFPSGAPIGGRGSGLLGGGVPGMQMSAVLYSPDCAFFIETKGPPQYVAAEGQHLRGLKAEAFVAEARLWMLAYAAVLAVQIQLLLAQVRETYTPSTLGRASFYTVAMMLQADGVVFASASAWTLTASASFLPSLAVTFAGFLSVTIGGGFLSEIYAAQEPERRRRQRRRQQERRERQERQQQQQPPASDLPIIVPSDQDIDAEIAEIAEIEHAAVSASASSMLLPLPATAPGDSTTAAPAADDTALPSFSNIAGRLTVLGLAILFLSLAASTWWAAARSAYANILAAVYLSMWVPQIVRNVERNSRRAFGWRFMIGQSATRLAPVAYFWLRADNVLFARPDRRAFVLLAAWLWVQLWVLALQGVLGPRFGVPAGWAPEAWEYHPVLREDMVEAGRLPIGLAPIEGGVSVGIVDGDDGHVPKRRHSRPGSTASASDAAAAMPNTSLWTVDCAICCEALDVPVARLGSDDTAAGGGVAGVLVRRQYMVTPCRHIFHTTCLEGWLRFRLQCPICREELPPL